MNYFDKAVTIANCIVADYENNNKRIAYWKDSPLYEITKLPPRTKGKYGEELVAELLSSYQIDILKSDNTKHDFKISYNGGAIVNVEIKTSFIWSGIPKQNYIYKFQQIRVPNDVSDYRDNDYNLLLCLGISKDNIKLYPFTKKDYKIDNKKYSVERIHKNGNLKMQHSKTSCWIEIQDNNKLEWHSTGDISEALEFIESYLMQL